jgi:hypothetical protein
MYVRISSLELKLIIQIGHLYFFDTRSMLSMRNKFEAQLKLENERHKVCHKESRNLQRNELSI